MPRKARTIVDAISAISRATGLNVTDASTAYGRLLDEDFAVVRAARADISSVSKETFDQRFHRYWIEEKSASLAQSMTTSEMLGEIHLMLFALCQDRGLVEVPE